MALLTTTNESSRSSKNAINTKKDARTIVSLLVAKTRRTEDCN